VNLFGFCGYVSGVKLTPDGEGPNQIAIVEFWDKNAAITAFTGIPLEKEDELC
jgi:hypothetical protein